MAPNSKGPKGVHLTMEPLVGINHFGGGVPKAMPIYEHVCLYIHVPRILEPKPKVNGLGAAEVRFVAVLAPILRL